MLDFEWLEFSLKSGCEISRYVVGNLKLLFLFVQVELRLFCIRVKLRILFDIIRSHVIWILVLDHLVLSFDTFRARYAFVILTFEILIQISFNKLWIFVRALIYAPWLFLDRDLPLSLNIGVLILSLIVFFLICINWFCRDVLLC